MVLIVEAMQNRIGLAGNAGDGHCKGSPGKKRTTAGKPRQWVPMSPSATAEASGKCRLRPQPEETTSAKKELRCALFTKVRGTPRAFSEYIHLIEKKCCLFLSRLAGKASVTIV
jgi:hypothetical protein